MDELLWMDKYWLHPQIDIDVDQNVEACFELATSHLNGLGFKYVML